VIRRLLLRLLDRLGPAPLDMGMAEPLPASEVEAIVERAKVRECRSDDWDAHVDEALALANSPWLLTEEDLLGLTSATDLAPGRPHEGTAAERVGGAR
jgi:hypothetical protein